MNATARSDVRAATDRLLGRVRRHCSQTNDDEVMYKELIHFLEKQLRFWDQEVNILPNLRMPLAPFTFFFMNFFLLLTVGSNK